MNAQEFLSQVGARGMLVSDNRAYGEMAGYPFVLRPAFRKAHTVSAVFLLAKPVKRAQRLQLQQMLKESGRVQVHGAKVTLIVCSRNDNIYERLMRGIQLLTEGFQKAHVTVPDQCPFCHESNCDTLAVADGFYVPAHQYCVNRSMQVEGKNGKPVSAAVGGYMGALCMAILLAAAALLPNLISLWLLGRIYVWFYTLIPLGAYFGFRMGKGRMGHGVMPLVILLSLVGVAATQLMQQTAFLHEASGAWPGIWESFQSFYLAHPLSETLESMIQPLVLTALGVFIAYGQLRGDRDAKVALVNGKIVCHKS